MDPQTPIPVPSATPPQPPPPAMQPVISPSPKSSKTWLVILIFIVVLALVAGGAWWFGRHSSTPKAAVKTQTTAKKVSTTPAVASTVPGLQLDDAKNYGNTYADGIVPVGDGHYTTTAAKQGYIYACNNYAQNLASSQGQGGAGVRGPWFTNNNTRYDLTKKVHVAGSVMWQASFTNTVNGDIRTIATNDLPTHPTGIFPITSSDNAYAYDRNPNTIKGQTLTYALNAAPSYGDPQCMGGEVGVMLTGVALFNAFDAGGRDAGAWEVQDACDGHPQMDGEYHYHTLSACIKDTSVHTVIGYALDGFPITGPNVGTNNILTTANLDACHGITSTITLNGKQVTMYHYVMTQDFPYSVSCFRSTPIQPPGLKQQ